MPEQNMSAIMLVCTVGTTLPVAGSYMEVKVWAAFWPASPVVSKGWAEAHVRSLPLGRTAAETGTFGNCTGALHCPTFLAWPLASREPSTLTTIAPRHKSRLSILTPASVSVAPSLASDEGHGREKSATA